MMRSVMEEMRPAAAEWENGEVARAGAEVVGCRDVEPREPERAAEEIEAGDKPADLVRYW